MTDEVIAEKCRKQIESWINNHNTPSYLKHSRLIPLSKSNSQYPNVGDVRTIAVLPAFSKIHEKLLLVKLSDEGKNLNLLHPT